MKRIIGCNMEGDNKEEKTLEKKNAQKHLGGR